MQTMALAAAADPAGINLPLANLTDPSLAASAWSDALRFLLGSDVVATLARSGLRGDGAADRWAGDSGAGVASTRNETLRFLTLHPSKCRHVAKLKLLDEARGFECPKLSAPPASATRRRRRRLRFRRR